MEEHIFEMPQSSKVIWEFSKADGRKADSEFVFGTADDDKALDMQVIHEEPVN